MAIASSAAAAASWFQICAEVYELICLGLLNAPLLPVSIPTLMLGASILDGYTSRIKRHAKCVAICAAIGVGSQLLYVILLLSSLAEDHCAAAYAGTDWCVATRHAGCSVEQYKTIGHQAIRGMCDACQGSPAVGTCGPDIRCTATDWQNCPEHDRSFEAFCGLCDFFHSGLVAILLVSALLCTLPIMVLAIVVACKAPSDGTIAPFATEVEMSTAQAASPRDSPRDVEGYAYDGEPRGPPQLAGEAVPIVRIAAIGIPTMDES